MDESLAELLAEREIRKQLNNYCRAMDRCDVALGKSVFHADAQVDYGDMFRGSGADFVEFTIRSHGQLRNHMHRITNVQVEVSGERGGSEAYADARFRMEHGGKLIELYTRGRYIDQWEQRDGRWAISQRAYVHEMDGQFEAGAERYPPTGHRHAGDPSYSALALR